jgi:threonine/homoserine/homoserine lactone efflux protein
MITSLDLSLVILALLLTPGPTNTLMLLAGAERGLAAAMRLIPAELAGYLLTVVPLALAGQTVLETWPGLRLVVALVAAGWVALLALRLWRGGGASEGKASVGARALFVTTALNPKALIFGLVLLPDPDRLIGNLTVFAGLVVAVAILWAGIGAGLRGASGQPRALVVIRRLASVALAAMSVLLVLRVVAA